MKKNYLGEFFLKCKFLGRDQKLTSHQATLISLILENSQSLILAHILKAMTLRNRKSVTMSQRGVKKRNWVWSIGAPRKHSGK